MSTDTQIDTKIVDNSKEANSVAAVLLAAGIGCFAMGIVTTLSESLKPIANILNLYKPTGPLSGKSLTAIVVWLAAWAVLGRAAQGKQINVGRWITFAMICVVLGFITTFPPFFDLFGDK